MIASWHFYDDLAWARYAEGRPTIILLSGEVREGEMSFRFERFLKNEKNYPAKRYRGQIARQNYRESTPGKRQAVFIPGKANYLVFYPGKDKSQAYFYFGDAKVTLNSLMMAAKQEPTADPEP